MRVLSTHSLTHSLTLFGLFLAKLSTCVCLTTMTRKKTTVTQDTTSMRQKAQTTKKTTTCPFALFSLFSLLFLLVPTCICSMSG